MLIIKIESNIDYNRTKEKGQSAVKGCGIYFDDDSPQVVSDLLSHEGINGDVTLQLVGPDGEYDTLAKKIFGSANVHGRAWVIYQWLKVLREVNFHYQDDDELPGFDEVKAILKKANNSLVENARHDNDESIVRETEISKDDVRKIRHSCVSDEDMDDMKVGNEDSDFPLRSVFLTSAQKGDTDVDQEYLKRAAKVLDVNKEQGRDTKAISRRERSPLNDYENGDVTLAKASPDVFIFGRAYGKGPTLNTFENEHLLMQYTASAASNRPLIFHLFESKWRHGVIGSMHAKVSSNQEGFNLFAGEFSTDEFQAKLQLAITNPSGKEAKYVTKKLVPILNYAGRNSAFGALERNESAGQILALGRRYGCAPAFDTLGIDDVNHPLSIRFALPSSSNHNFPAVVSTASQIEMRRGIKLKERCDGIPFNWSDRFQVMINNPVGAAKAYIDVVDDIMTILNSIKPSLRTTKTEFKPQDDVGITGSSHAFFGKTETTGSGSLHFHVVKWGGISPELLESVADIPELCKKVAVVLDSMYSAKLNRHEHVQDLVQKNMRYVKSTKTKRLAVDSTSSSAQDDTENTSIGDMASSSPLKTAQDKDNNTNDSDSDSDVHMKEESHLVSQDTNLVQDTSTPPIKENDIVDPHDITRHDTSVPGAFAECSKKLKRCQDMTCQREGCNEEVLIKWTDDDSEMDVCAASFNAKREHTKPQDNQDTSVDTSASPSNKPIVLSQDTSSDEDSVTDNSTPQARSRRPLPRATMEIPDPKEEPEKFKTHVALTVCCCGIHIHSFTCKKPPKGWHGCRLCYMKALSNGGTKPIELVSTVEPDGSIGWTELDSLTHNFEQKQTDGTIISVQQEYVGSYDPKKHTSKDNAYPLRSDISRTVIWELDRPELKPFEMLDTDNVTKDEIITSLYQQMIVDKPGRTPLMFEDGCEKISMDQIDLHIFDRAKKNHLFYSLILGLIETYQIEAGSKSVEGLRRELIQSLRQMPLHYKLGGKTVEEHIKSRMSRDDTTTVDNTTTKEKVELYSQLMMNADVDDCYEGGALEVYLFARVMKVNVAVYAKEGDNDLSRVESESYNTRGERDRPTIHLLRVKDTTSSQGLGIAATLKPPTYTYTLFTPKLKSIMDKLQDFDTKDLVMLYNLVAKGLPERNGWVVDFNPILAGLLGSNTNLLHLGSTEQSKSALFYIGPYINKDGVKITDALPLLKKAYEHAQNFPSSAEDSGTNKRTVQHALTRALNKLNALVEVSDTQAVSSLLRMKPSLCSDTFVTCDTKAYQKYVNAELQRIRDLKGKDMYGYDSSDTDEEKGYLSETDFLLGEESSEHLMKVEDDDTGHGSDLEDPMDVDEDNQDTPPVAVGATASVTTSDVIPKDSIELWDPSGDGSCMYWCFLEDTNQECTVSNCAALRRDINIYISEHPNECIHPDIEGYTLSEWVLNNLKDITQRRGIVINEENPIMQYAQLMNIATSHGCEYGSALEACVFAVLKNRNVAIYDEASPEDSGHPLQMKKVISDDAPSTYLLYCNGRSHYKLMKMTSGRGRKRKKSSENLEDPMDVDEESVDQYDDCNTLDPESKKRLAENRKMYDLNQNEDTIEADFNFINAEHGVAHVYRKNDGSKMPVSYPALYRYRGEELKHMNRYQYTALVKVESSKEDDSSRTVDTKTSGRKKSKPFMFADGLGIEKYNYQVLRTKQLTPKFITSPPPLPKIEPQPPDLEESDEDYEDQMKQYKREHSAWKKKADKFAHFYLTMFRAEDELYQKGQDNRYKYDYEAFVEFYEQLICKSYFYIDDRLLLEQMERVMYTWRVDRVRREMLAAHRARARTKWSAEEKEAAKSYWGNRNTSTSCQQGDVGMDYISSVASDLSRKQKTNANKHLGHCRELMDTLENLIKTSNEDSSYPTQAKGPISVVNVSTQPFDSFLDESKRQKQSPQIEVEDDGVQTPPPRFHTIPDLKKNVNEYIKSQDLSADKDIVVKLARDHFEAIRSHKAFAKDYEAPNLLVCGKPGSGKSKLIETLDGMAEIMKVGQQMKCAYMGAAAVNIGGTTLLGPWNIPVFNKGEKRSFLGWDLNKLQAFKNRFDRNVDNICAVVIDEISTVQPYMLAYLNLRMQQMFGNDKPFGGRMIILLGDFEQKPPTSGSNLPAVVMQHIEEKGKPLTSKSVDKLSLAKMGGYLFTKFRYIKLTSQHRSGDPKHTAVIDKMSDTGKISIGDLKTYKKLSGKDLDGDDFRFATILVTGNMERREINARQAKRYALYHKVNVIRWARKRLESKWIGKPKTEACIAHAMQNSCFWELFISGAKGFLNTYNINGDIGLANGTEIKYHSLSFENRVEGRKFDTLFTQAKPGEIIDLDSPPTAINVELFADFEEDTSATKAKKKAYRKEWLQSGKGSITNDGRVVIPISRQDGSQIKYDSTYVPGCKVLETAQYYDDSKLEMKDHFPIEPAFSITIDKAQGKTIHRIILSISKHSFHLNKMTWEGLFVSLSRVRSGDHMRLFIKRGDWSTVRYVSELRQNKYTGMFFNGYTDHPDGDGSMIWDFSLAKKNAGFDGKRKFGGKTAKAKKRPRRESTIIGWNKKIHRGEDGTWTILDRG